MMRAKCHGLGCADGCRQADRVALLGQWIAELEAMPEADRQAAVDARSAEVDATPLTEDGGLVHFTWRGETASVIGRERG